MITHILKIWPDHYSRVRAGTKTFEIRNNDRVFQKGDKVILRPYTTEKLSAMDTHPTLGGGYLNLQELSFKIGDVYPIDAERVVFSLLKEGE